MESWAVRISFRMNWSIENIPPLYCLCDWLSRVLHLVELVHASCHSPCAHRITRQKYIWIEPTPNTALSHTAQILISNRGLWTAIQLWIAVSDCMRCSSTDSSSRNPLWWFISWRSYFAQSSACSQSQQIASTDSRSFPCTFAFLICHRWFHSSHRT